MAKRTFEKRLRKFDIVKGVDEKLKLIPRTTLRAPMARLPHIVKCPNGKEITIMVAPGQIINTNKICKRNQN